MIALPRILILPSQLRSSSRPRLPSSRPLWHRCRGPQIPNSKPPPSSRHLERGKLHLRRRPPAILIPSPSSPRICIQRGREFIVVVVPPPFLFCHSRRRHEFVLPSPPRLRKFVVVIAAILIPSSPRPAAIKTPRAFKAEEADAPVVGMKRSYLFSLLLLLSQWCYDDNDGVGMWRTSVGCIVWYVSSNDDWNVADDRRLGCVVLSFSRLVSFIVSRVSSRKDPQNSTQKK